MLATVHPQTRGGEVAVAGETDRAESSGLSTGVAAGVAAGVVVLTIVIARVLTEREPLAELRSLEQPFFALPSWGWIAAAVVYYALVGVVTARLLRRFPTSWGGLVGIALVLAAGETWAWLLFDVRDLVLAFAGLILFAAMLMVAMAHVRRHDELGFRLLGVYLAWVLVYDIPWSLFLVVLN